MPKNKKLLKIYLPILIITLIALFLRLWRLKYPQELVFDEFYYADFAQKYLLGQSFTDAHPPLSKIIIAFGIKLFGYNSFGWRIFPALISTLIIPLTYLVAEKIFKNRQVALLASVLILLDGLFLVEARTGLIMGMLPTFILFGYLFVLIFMEKKNYIYLTLSGIFFGLSLSIQWLALPFWAILLFFILQKNKINLKMILGYFVIPALIYFCVFFFDSHNTNFQNIFQYFIFWNKQTFTFHFSVKADHPYSSKWWTWLYIGKPVWFYYKEIESKTIDVIALGNYLIWWPAIPVFIYSLYYTFKNRVLSLLLPIFSFIIYYSSWIFVSRLQFQYYIYLALPFYFMVLAYFWHKLFLKNKVLGYLYLLLILLVFIFFYPILTALPTSIDYVKIVGA